MEKKKVINKKTKTTKKTTKRKTNEKKKLKGFTLIELLAVIIILGILMIIAIPSVTKYISSSRDDAYITSAKEIVAGARNLVNTGELNTYNTDVTYYIPYSCIKTENDSSSPYGEWEDAYVVFTYDGTGYDYYWTSIDDARQGVYLTSTSLLDSDRLVRSAKEINTGIAISGHNKVSILDKETCKVFSEPSSSTYQMPKSSYLSEEQYEELDQYIVIYINDKAYSVLKDTTWYDLKGTEKLSDHSITYLSSGGYRYSYVGNKSNVNICVDATHENNVLAAEIYMSRNGVNEGITGGSWNSYCVIIITDNLGMYNFYNPVIYYRKEEMTEGEFNGLTYTCTEPILNSENKKEAYNNKPIANYHYHTNNECDGFTIVDVNFTSV